MDKLNQIYNGDCIKIMNELISQNIKVDAIITDIPYGSTSCSWDVIIPFDDMWDCIRKIRKESCPIILFANEPFASYLRISNIKEFKYDWVWKKSKSGSAFTAQYRPVNKHEMICVFGKGKINYYPQCIEGEPYKRNLVINNYDADKNNHKIGFHNKGVKTDNNGFRYPITVQEFQQNWRRQDQMHPTQKPLELMKYLVKTYSQENDTVLDFTCGSGTTLLACKVLNRNFIGIEKEEKYYEIAKKRLEENKDILKKEEKKQTSFKKKLI